MVDKMSNFNEKSIQQNIIIKDEQVDTSCSYNSNISGDQQNNSLQQSKNVIVCEVNDCGKEYRNKYSYKRHLETIHSEKTLRCDHSECDYVTSSKRYLRKHSIKHSNDRPFTCKTDGCGKTFKRKTSLMAHQTCHRSKTIPCTREGCGKTFKAEIYLKRHYLDIHSSKSYVCGTCGKGFDSRGKRHYHQKVVHEKSEEPIVCQNGICKKEFKNQYYYRRHVWQSHSGKVLRCDQCGYITGDRERMRVHALIHSDTLSYVCGIGGCDKAFKMKTYLNKHKKNHTLKRFI